MINEKELQELTSFTSSGAPVLSLYLDTDLSQQSKENRKLVLRDSLERVKDSAAAEDVAKVETFFDLEYDWQGKGVALFSASRSGFWRVYPLAVPIQSEAHTGERPYVKPLAQVLNEYPRYGVALVDQEQARLFLIHLGQIEEKGGWAGQYLKHHKQGGYAASRLQRRVDQQAQQNLKKAAETLVHFCEENQCSRLILSGSAQTLPRFRGLLPKALQKQVVGTLGLDVTAPASEVMVRSVELIAAQEAGREQQLVEDLVTAAAKGGGAVIGLADTFYNAHQGRVHTLVLERGFEVDGYLCPGCGYVSSEPITKCPFCGGKPEAVAGAVNRVVQKVIQSGGKVETVAVNEALAKAGHIGAILRY